MKRWMIVGLGNPGKDYAATRHNIGFMVARAFASAYGMVWKESSKLEAWKAEDNTTCVVLPTTYMNASGVAVKKCLREFNLSPSQMIVVSDDADLPFGALRFRKKGGTGGHNGLKSIQGILGTQEYPRLKIGIGRVEGSLVDHVLGQFDDEEMKQLPNVIEQAVKILKEETLEGLGENIFNESR